MLAVACGMAFLALDSERPKASALIVLMFAGFLRTEVALTMESWQAEPLEVGVRAVLHLPKTKPVERKIVRNKM